MKEEEGGVERESEDGRDGEVGRKGGRETRLLPTVIV